MLDYRGAVFREERIARGLAAVALSCALLGLGAPAAADSSGAGVVPADGRLNTPDFMAKITSVTWPARNDGHEPTPGRRFVAFGLEVSALARSASPTAPGSQLAAALRWNESSHPLSLSSIDNGLASGVGNGGGDSASASYMASVPSDTHDVDLVLTEGTFSQSFDLWTLRRVPPSPAVLYRDPTETTIAGSAAGPTTLALSNPSDGFMSSAAVTLQSATLGFVTPPGTTVSPNPDQAVLSVVLDGEFPSDPNDPTASGHYLGSRAPVPAGLLSFTPSGGTAVPANLSDQGDTAGKGSSDDGLFDATYSFLVPGTLTAGTLEIAAESFTGAEFTLYTAETGTTTLDVSAPATLALSIPAPVAHAAQKTPPWVGEPAPPTSAASASAARGSGGSSTSQGFPVWVAVVVLLVVAAGAVLVERWRRSRRLTAAPTTATAATATSNTGPPPSSASVVVAGSAHTSEGDEGEGVDAAGAVRPVAADATEVGGASAPFDDHGPFGTTVILNVLGARQILGVEIDSSWALLTELFTYLVFHDHRHLKAAQIAIGLRPNGPKDLDEKTVRNALTRLRRSVGAEHLPQASAEGYLVEGIDSDWAAFERLSRQAETTGGEDALALRKEALALVRGAPFDDVNDEWVDFERLRSNMVVAIVMCAQRLAADLLEAARSAEAEEAASAGIRGAPRHYVLWELGARAICARSDLGRLELWMSDARANLDQEDVARLERSVADHRGPSA